MACLDWLVIGIWDKFCAELLKPAYGIFQKLFSAYEYSLLLYKYSL